MTISVIECEANTDAVQWADASGQREAVNFQGRPCVIPQSELDRIVAAGISFACLLNHEMSDGSYQIMTVSVN
jgi:hypothetical protein